MKYLFTYKLFENMSNEDVKKQIYEILSNLDFLDVKIKEHFDGKKKKILQHLNIHNFFKISITLKKDGVDLSKLHSHKIKFSEIKDEVKLIDQINGFNITSCSMRSGMHTKTNSIDRINDNDSGKLIILELKRNPTPILASNINMDIFLQLKDLGVTTNIIQYDKYSLFKFTLPKNRGNDEIFSQIAESIEQCISIYNLKFIKIIKLETPIWVNPVSFSESEGGQNKAYNTLQEFEDSDKTKISYISCILEG
jgi:hypothetical protein